MTKELSEYWSQLDGAVHPADMLKFELFPDHGFSLDFPPPAFIGDVINAPIIILDNNGGYDASLTPAEFPDRDAHDEFQDMLANPRPVSRNERTLSPYYLGRNYTQWLVDGVATLAGERCRLPVDRREGEACEPNDEIATLRVVSPALATGGFATTGGARRALRYSPSVEPLEWRR